MFFLRILPRILTKDSISLVVPIALRKKPEIINLTELHIRHGSKMPKKSSSGKGGAKNAPAKDASASTKPSDTAANANNSPISVGKNGDISISIQVKPGAKTDSITDISDTSIGVQISAPPVDGEANTAIVKYFAEILKLKKTDVSIKGGKSRQKTVLVSSTAGMTSDKIITLLQAEHQQR